MRLAQAASVAVLAVVMLGADSSEGRFNRIGHNLMCSCGCAQVLLECNHVSCPDSPKMIAELRQQVSLGGPDNGVLNFFTAEYGATVLAAPIRGGFDNVAWIMPFAVFFMATVGTAVLIKVWRARHAATPVMARAAGGETSEAEAMRARIRRETEF